MRKFTAATLIVVTIAIIGGGSFFVLQQHNTSHTPTDNTSPEQNPLRATITFDGDSFEPEITTISLGGIVKIVNQSSKELSFKSSSPSGAQKDELTVGTVDPGVSKSVTLHHTGTWNFHNSLKTSQRGQVIVK